MRRATSIDLLVVGGGINGAGIARDAAGRGLSVVLCEKDDFAQGTSSRSGKYIHGGLRYIEYYEFNLVRKALIEREVILGIASHLAYPMRLVLPHSPSMRPRWLIRLGLFLYDHLGGRKRIPPTSSVDLKKVPEGEAFADEFRRAFAYWDVWVDDSRLVVLNAVDAHRKGAEILRDTEFLNAKRADGFWEAELRNSKTGETRTVCARAIVNAAGPWVENVIGLVDGVKTSARIRLVRGSHVILKKWWKGDCGFTLQAFDGRLIFVNPYFDDLALVGTTDIPFEGRPEDAQIDIDEIRYLIKVVKDYFDIDLSEGEVLSSYSGVRPLFDDDEAKGASAVTRDYRFELDGDSARAPMLSAFGGKLTTYRKLAEEALDKLKLFLPGMKGPWTGAHPLPGGDIPNADFEGWLVNFRGEYPWLPEKLLRHYGRCYGTEAKELLAGAESLSCLGRHFGSLLYEREARWLVDREWAKSAEDILVRRTKHGLFLLDSEKADLERWLEQIDQTN